MAKAVKSYGCKFANSRRDSFNFNSSRESCLVLLKAKLTVAELCRKLFLEFQCAESQGCCKVKLSDSSSFTANNTHPQAAPRVLGGVNFHMLHLCWSHMIILGHEIFPRRSTKGEWLEITQAKKMAVGVEADEQSLHVLLLTPSLQCSRTKTR